jgi:hypothetical protein
MDCLPFVLALSEAWSANHFMGDSCCPADQHSCILIALCANNGGDCRVQQKSVSQ